MQYLAPKQVAAILDVKVDKARLLMRDPGMRAVNIGTEQREQLRVEIEDLKAYLKRHSLKPEPLFFQLPKGKKASQSYGSPSGPIPYRK